MSDGLVLTAAAAAALALQRWTWGDFMERGGWKSVPFYIGPAPEPPLWIKAKDAVVLGSSVAWAYVVVLAPTLLLLRLVPPRPSRARMMRQAGTSACVALVIVLAYHALDRIAQEILPTFLMDEDEFDLEQFRTFVVAEFLYRPWNSGLAVAAAWAPAAFAGRLQAEPTWIDRAGRLLGFYALACVPFSWLLTW